MKKAQMKIDREGRWFFEGEEITHRKTYLLYCRSLTRNPKGEIVVRVGKEECPVEVEDTPFVVRSLETLSSPQGAVQEIQLILNDETREALDPQSLRIGEGNIPYCRVRGGLFEARFSRGAYQLLAPLISHDEKKNRFSLQVGGKTYLLKNPA